MTIIVGYVPTPEGEAAVRAGAAEASVSGERVIVVNSATGASVDSALAPEDDLARVRGVMEEHGLDYEVRVMSRATDGADGVLDTASQEQARLIILGLRRRTATGKFLFGSTAQRILLEADCSVLSVKAGGRG